MYQPKKFEGKTNRVLLKFCDVFPNLDFLALYEYKKKFCLQFRVKTKKRKKLFTLNLILFSAFSVYFRCRETFLPKFSLSLPEKF